MMRNRLKLARVFGCRGGGVVAVVLFGLGAPAAYGEAFSLPADGSDLIGEIRYARASHEDTLIDIARRFSVGQEEMTMANPTVDTWLPKEGTQVVLPRRFILPNAPRAGIVVNVPEMRIYYYPVQYATVARKQPVALSKPGAKGKAASPKAPEPATQLGEPISRAAQVITYPVSMGRMDWRTPLGKTQIMQKVKDPTWTPPESIKREHALKGEILPDVVPAGPNNPLGQFAMKLGVAGYLIHGTESADKTKPFGIGMRVTHGCMRMYNEDVAELFPQVAVGTPVYLVNQPVKLGWQGGALYMEVSLPLDEDVGIPPEWDEDAMADNNWSKDKIKETRLKREAMRTAYLTRLATDLIGKESARHPLLQVDSTVVRNALGKPSGIPVVIGKESPVLEATPGQSLPGQYPQDPYGAPPALPGQGGSGDYASPSMAPVPDPYGAGQPTPGPYSPQAPAQNRSGIDTYSQPRSVSGPSGVGQAVTPGQYSQYPYGDGGYPPAQATPDPYGAGRTVPGQYTAPTVPSQPGSPQAAPPDPYRSYPQGQYNPGGYDQAGTAAEPYGTDQTTPEQYAAPPIPDQYTPKHYEPGRAAPNAYPAEQYDRYDTGQGAVSRPAPGAYTPESPYAPIPYVRSQPAQPPIADPYVPSRPEPAPTGPDPYAPDQDDEDE